jgi:adhesin transport system outer membrane protein
MIKLPKATCITALQATIAHLEEACYFGYSVILKMALFQTMAVVFKKATFVAVFLLTLSCPFLVQSQSLERLIEESLFSHPQVQAQSALVASSQAGVESARWQFFPTPSITVESANNNTEYKIDQGYRYAAIFRLQQPIWTGGRLGAGLDKAHAGHAVTLAARAEVHQQLALSVVQAYGDWLGAYNKRKIYVKSQAKHLRFRDQVRRRIEQGVSAESDLTLVQVRIDALAADIELTTSQISTALARLAQLLGRPSVEKDLLDLDSRAPSLSLSPEGLITITFGSLHSSPSIRKSQAFTKVQEAVLAERLAEMSPEVYLRAEQQYGNSINSVTANKRNIFLGLTSRFGAGLSNFSITQTARSQYEAALADVEIQSRLVTEQVTSDYALAVSLEIRLNSLQASLNLAEQVSESYDRQFLAGRKTWLEVMNAARELTQTEAQLADIESAQLVVNWRLAIYSKGLESALAAKR